MMAEKVLVTGGAGCIGSELCAALLGRGAGVVALDNLSSGRYEHIEALLNDRNFTFIEGDTLDAQALDDSLLGVETVYHLAANPDIKYTPGDATDKDLRQNTLATYHLLEAMRRRGIRRLAFSSTSAIYGICEQQPITESQSPQPISLYGATKLSCEVMISAFQHLFDMQCWIFRFANIVGAKTRKRGSTVIADFVRKLQADPSRLEILGNGRQLKSYLLSQECVDAMLYIVEHAKAPFNIYNLGCRDAITVDEIARIVVEKMNLTGVKFTRTGTEGGWPGDVPRFILDVSKLNQLGWEAQHTSREAVESAVDSTLTRALSFKAQ